MPERMASVDEPTWAAGNPLAAPVDEEDHVDGPTSPRVLLVLYGDYESLTRAERMT